MKKIDVSRLERLRARNLKIGFALSLLLIVLAFQWTTERPPLPVSLFEEVPDMEVKVIRTPYKKEQKKPLPKPVVENKIIIEADVPDFLETEIELAEPVVAEGAPLEGVGELIKPAAPAVLPRPEEQPEKEAPFIIVEDMPRFQGCDDDGMTRDEKKSCTDSKLLTFLSRHLRYPAMARENGVEGTVVIRFVIEKDGRISGAEVMRDIGFGCGMEALRVVNSMPQWIPGKQRGRAVRVQYNLPVKYKLK